MSKKNEKDVVAIRKCDICGKDFEINFYTVFKFMCAPCKKVFHKALDEGDTDTLAALYEQHFDKKHNQ